MNFGNIAGQLAGQILENTAKGTGVRGVDVGGVLSKLGEVIAPRDDDYEDDDDESSYESYYEEEEVEYDENGNEIDTNSTDYKYFGNEEQEEEEEEIMVEFDNDQKKEMDNDFQRKDHTGLEFEDQNPLVIEDLHNSSLQDINDKSLENPSHVFLEEKQEIQKDDSIKSGCNIPTMQSSPAVSSLTEGVSSFVPDQSELMLNDANENKSDKINDKVIPKNLITDKTFKKGDYVSEKGSNNSLLTAGTEQFSQANDSILCDDNIDINNNNSNSLHQLLKEKNLRIQYLEKVLKYEKDSKSSKFQQQKDQQQRSLSIAEQKLKEESQKLQHVLAKINKYESVLENLRNQNASQNKTLKKYKEELGDLRSNNSDMRNKISKLQSQNLSYEKQIEEAEEQQEQAQGLHIELQLLKEETARNQLVHQNATESNSDTLQKITSERDEFRSLAQSLQQQLDGTLADLDLVKNDLNRTLTSRMNLQDALEAFQNERDSEIQILEEQRIEKENVLIAANEAKIQAVKEENNRIMSQVQHASDMAVKNAMEDISTLEQKEEVSGFYFITCSFCNSYCFLTHNSYFYY